MSVLIETTIGDIVVDLFVKERPRTCLNFLKLCKMKYYNFCEFHSVEQNYIAQTGDPTGTGRGGDSIFSLLYGEQARYFEMEKVPRLKHRKKGTFSMVNNGEEMHGSQFFVTLGEDLDYLDGEHTIFGQVAEGFQTLDKLNEAICDDHKRPYRDIRISHTTILDDPFDDPKDLHPPSRSPSPSQEIFKTSRIGVEEEVDEYAGKAEEDVKEEIETKEAKARAHILEMVGDLHHADEKPPDNVLFVCKLNPVTTDEDLEIIFSRFGKIKCCEVIRDKKSGDSLQYAFVEFDDPESCEKAYFKMDNVLIDDRRIHVDFSQSVSKNYTWKPDGKEEKISTEKAQTDKQKRRSSSPSQKKKKKKSHRKDSEHHHSRHHKSHRHHRRSRSRSPKRR